jgi:predicted PurR-regulated permease PerM
MAVTPQQFFSKNMKWIALVLLFLFGIKSVQSCNRNMRLNIASETYISQIDSLENKYNTYYKESQDSIKDLNFLLELANEKAGAANDRANAVQSAVEKIKSNTTTTVVVKGAEEVKDTTKK